MPAEFESACQKNKSQKVVDLTNSNLPLGLDVRNKESKTGLIIASENGSIDVVTFLIENLRINKENLNAADCQGYTALHHAAQNNHFGVVQELVCLKIEIPKI